MQTINPMEYKNRSYEELSAEFKLSVSRAVELVPLMYNRLTLIDKYSHKAAITSEDLGQYDEAIKCYDKALKIHPRCKVVLVNKAYPLHHLGQYDEAIKCAKKVIEISPSYAYTDAYNIIGASLYNLSRFSEAIPYFNKALEIDPEDAYAIDMLDRINTVSRNTVSRNQQSPLTTSKYDKYFNDPFKSQHATAGYLGSMRQQRWQSSR